MNGITRVNNVTREFEVKVEKNCPCPDFEDLLRNRSLGSEDAEVIVTGNYLYGIPTITQRSLGVEASSVNKNRMRSNVRQDLCTLLEDARNLQRMRE